MTYIVVAPDANQSPGQFPAQANENFLRLKTIINADHTFNDTAAVNDGSHKQMTMVNRSDPAGPPAAGTNAMIFTKAAGSTSLPYFWDGTDSRQMGVTVTGTTTVTTSQTIFADPGYEYVGTITVMSTTNVGVFNQMAVVNRTSYGNIVNNVTLAAGTNTVTFSFSGNTLVCIKAVTLSSATIKWYLNIARIA